MKLGPGSKWNFVYICADFCNQRAFLKCILMTEQKPDSRPISACLCVCVCVRVCACACACIHLCCKYMNCVSSNKRLNCEQNTEVHARVTCVIL
jgi:hypothetical protein